MAQRENLFSDLNAYNPVPSPDGKSVAFVELGWGQEGDRGFGRSSLNTTIYFATKDGRRSTKTNVRAFLGEWATDSSAAVCFRDYKFGLVSEKGWQLQENMPPRPPPVLGAYAPAERVAYVDSKGFVWLQRTKSKTLIETPNGPMAQIDAGLPTSDLIVVSPNARYLAIASTVAGEGFHLWVYDTQNKISTDFGETTIHPDRNWDYLKPSWNPWFRDSSRLTYISAGALYTSTPDGREKHKLMEVKNAGLPVPSIDGTRIAYVSFVPRPMKLRPDLQFWGGTTVWVLDIANGKTAAVTQPSPDTTLDLRWLDDSSLLLDRITEEPFYKHDRIWTVDAKAK